MQDQHPEDPQQASAAEQPGRAFHLWRLLGGIGVVILMLAAAAALVDVMVLGW